MVGNKNDAGITGTNPEGIREQVHRIGRCLKAEGHANWCCHFI